MEKVFKTHKEQLNRLAEKGLVFQDEEYALNLLKRHNYYYLINGFSNPFLETKERYKDGVYLKEIESLFIFNERISTIILKYILKIEYAFKSQIAYGFSKDTSHNHTQYLRRENFRDLRNRNNTTSSSKIIEVDKFVSNVINILYKEISTQFKKDERFNHYISEHTYIPLWVVIQKISLGKTNILFENLKKETRELVTKNLNENNIFSEPSEKKIISYITILTDFRNLAAHNERLYNFIKRKKQKANFKKLIDIFEKLLNKEDNDNFIRELNQEFTTLKENINDDSFIYIQTEMGLIEN